MLKPEWGQGFFLKEELLPLFPQQKRAIDLPSKVAFKDWPLYKSSAVLKDFSPAKVISFQMLKGGVSKTTSALNLAVRLAQLGFRTLMVDLDQQANLTLACGMGEGDYPVWVDILEQEVSPQQAIVPVFAGLDLLPSSLNNSVVEKILLKSHRNWAGSVRQVLKPVREQYDFVVVDTAPNLSLLNTAVTLASDLIVLMVTPDPFAVSGLSMHWNELLDIEKEFEVIPRQKLVVLTRYDSREKLSERYLEELSETFGSSLADTFIRKSAELNKSLAEDRSIFHRKSPLREDYHLLTVEILHRLKEVNHAQSKGAGQIELV